MLFRSRIYFINSSSICAPRGFLFFLSKLYILMSLRKRFLHRCHKRLHIPLFKMVSILSRIYCNNCTIRCQSKSCIIKIIQMTPLYALVIVPLPIFEEHKSRQCKRHQFRRRRCQPDSIHAQNKRKHDHRNQHKHKRPRKCQDSRNYSIG